MLDIDITHTLFQSDKFLARRQFFFPHLADLFVSSKPVMSQESLTQSPTMSRRIRKSKSGSINPDGSIAWVKKRMNVPQLPPFHSCMQNHSGYIGVCHLTPSMIRVTRCWWNSRWSLPSKIEMNAKWGSCSVDVTVLTVVLFYSKWGRNSTHFLWSIPQVLVVIFAREPEYAPTVDPFWGPTGWRTQVTKWSILWTWGSNCPILSQMLGFSPLVNDLSLSISLYEPKDHLHSPQPFASKDLKTLELVTLKFPQL